MLILFSPITYNTDSNFDHGNKNILKSKTQIAKRLRLGVSSDLSLSYFGYLWGSHETHRGPSAFGDPPEF